MVSEKVRCDIVCGAILLIIELAPSIEDDKDESVNHQIESSMPRTLSDPWFSQGMLRGRRGERREVDDR